MFEHWLGTVSKVDFLEQYYLNRPYSVAQGASRFVSLLSWAIIHRILPLCDSSDLLVVRDGRLSLGTDPKSSSQAMALFEDGYSLVLRHAERQDPGLMQLASAFAAEFCADVAIQLYATPKQRHSFGWHYDAEEVFIVQTSGTKRYFLRENTVRPRPLLEAMPQDMEYEKEGSALMVCDLVPGDWLYVPSGFWHVARALEDSLSISIGVAAPTAMDLLDELRRDFAESVAWRKRLALIGPHADWVADLRQEAHRILGDSRLVERAIERVQQRHAAKSTAKEPGAAPDLQSAEPR